MKAKHIASFSLLALGFATAQAQEPKSAPASSTPPAAEAKSAFSDAQLLEEFGWFVGKRVGLTELAFSKAELDTFVKGMLAAAEGKDSPFELEKIGPAMDEFMQKKQQAYVSKMKERAASANTEFFKKLKENKAVVALPSGLHYEVISAGSGATPKSTDTVKVHYTGTLLDGAVFDSSVKRGTPAEFQLDQVIPGWTEGLQKVQKGGKIKLYVPPELGYGDEGRPGIPPASTLVFEVELLDIVGGAAAAPAAPAKK